MFPLVVVISVVALALGWDPDPGLPGALLAIVLGTAAFAALGLFLAGVLRAEATLAAANLAYLLMLVTGGIAIPLDRFPDRVQPYLEALPAGALSEGLREVLRDGQALSWWHVGVLVAWAVVAGVLTARTFRWE